MLETLNKFLICLQIKNEFRGSYTLLNNFAFGEISAKRYLTG